MLTPVPIARSGFIASGQVGWPHHASGAVRSGHVSSGSVLGEAGGGARTIASGTVAANDLASGSVLSGHVASGQIGGVHVASGQVGWANLGSGAVRSGHLGSGVVWGLLGGIPHVASGSLTGFELGSGAVVSGRVASGQIGNSHLGSGAVLSGHVASGQVGVNHLASGAVLSGAVASGQIGLNHIASGAVLSGHVASGQVGTNHLSSGAVVSGRVASGQVGRYHLASGLPVLLAQITPGGRLSPYSGVAYDLSGLANATTVYYVPAAHNVFPLYDGTEWVGVPFAQQAIALGTVTSGRIYDVFGVLSGGGLAFEFGPWTNGTTRASSLNLEDGRWCLSGNRTRHYVGSFRTVSTTQYSRTFGRMYLANAYNQVPQPLYLGDGNSHSYSGDWRPWNNDAAVRVEFIRPVPSQPLWGCYQVDMRNGVCAAGLTLDGTGVPSAPAAMVTELVTNATAGADFAGVYYESSDIGLGDHFFQVTEKGAANVSFFNVVVRLSIPG